MLVLLLTLRVGLAISFLLYGKVFEPRVISYMSRVIVRVRVILRKTVVGDFSVSLQCAIQMVASLNGTVFYLHVSSRT